ncbi:hypothetical protein [Enterococcus faecalis]|uniref:hypothetical protein n=1 Tax=Enterococcus faecalis TaxID=1351 RepID=UPI0027378CF7|nr:hypothetical protein [Enterococcus faecalis]
MKITQTELNNRKKLAKAIMEAKNEDHDTWLGEHYQQYISANQATLTKALLLMSKRSQPEKQNNNSTQQHTEGGQA